MTKTSIETRIASLVKSANGHKQGYYNDIQTAVELFLQNYNDSLGRNSTPLLGILLATGKDITALKKYLPIVSNISSVELNSDKNGLKLIFKQGSIEDKTKPLTVNNDLLESQKWYDIAKLENKKAVIAELTEQKIVARLKKLVKDIEDSSLDSKTKWLTALNKLCA